MLQARYSSQHTSTMQYPVAHMEAEVQRVGMLYVCVASSWFSLTVIIACKQDKSHCTILHLFYSDAVLAFKSL